MVVDKPEPFEYLFGSFGLLFSFFPVDAGVSADRIEHKYGVFLEFVKRDSESRCGGSRRVFRERRKRERARIACAELPGFVACESTPKFFPFSEFLVFETLACGISEVNTDESG